VIEWSDTTFLCGNRAAQKNSIAGTELEFKPAEMRGNIDEAREKCARSGGDAMVDFSFAAKSTPAILVLGGVLFIFLDNTAKTGFGIAPWVLIGLGIFVTLIWAGFFRRI
jgi:hypothetical protein